MLAPELMEEPGENVTEDEVTQEAVSYTHLDVYKRQVLNSPRNNICRSNLEYHWLGSRDIGV